MRCQMVGANHDLELIDLRRQRVPRERSGVFHFEGECRKCGASYWQHGSSMNQFSGWTLKLATSDCGCDSA